MGIQTTILRSVDATGGGHYRLGKTVAGLTTIAANGPVASFRWINTALRVLVHRITWGWFLSTAFGSAQTVDHGIYKATGFTGSDTSGSTGVVTPKKTADIGQFLPVLGTDFDFRVGTLAAGTRTLNADFFAARGAWGGAIGAGIMNPPADITLDIEHEANMVLGPGEGLVLNNLTVMGATGVLQLYFEIAFSLQLPANISV